MQDVLRQVKEVLGPEAIILSTKTTKKTSSFSGCLGPSSIEVVAAIDRDPLPSSLEGGRSLSATPEAGKGSTAGRLNILPRAGLGFARGAYSEQTLPLPPDARGPAEEDVLIQRILSTGIEPDFVDNLVREVQTVRKELKGWSLPEVYRRLLCWKVMESVEVIPSSLDGRKVWALVGPTGVGKTTTLAKLAAYFSLKVTPKITLITVDTFRIGALEQLKTYGRILRLPVEVAENSGELKQMIEKYRHQDLLLIDTTGSSPNGVGQIEQLKEFLTCHPLIENHLLLSATTKNKDLDLIAKRFSLFPIRSYIFTKIDETGDYGPILNQILRNKKPLSYLTNGQRVPEDIELASKVRVAHLFLNTIAWS